MRNAQLIFVLCNCFFTKTVLANSLRLGSFVGLMQQPASEYYTAVYGGEMMLGEDYVTTASFLERPKFRASGFEDQERGYFLLSGAKLTEDKIGGLYAKIGFGTMQGFIKSLDSDRESSYSLSGPAAELQYIFSWKYGEISFAHRMFAAYSTKEQFKAYVLWPYSFFTINFSYAFIL